MNIKTGRLCKIGGRQKNDDTVLISADNGAVRLYVGDGLGSYAGGKQASETAGQALMACRGSMLGDEELRSAAHMANQAVYDLQNSTKGTMKTTLVFLTIEDNQARWMHVGDSRLYHFKDGKLVKQTTDHSVSQMAVMMGEITTHQIRFHEDRNRVLRSLGGENAKPELSAVVDISEGNHAFLLCSDGFWEYVYEEEMELTLKQASDPDDWIARMEKILLERVTGNNDNYTAAAAICGSGMMGYGEGYPAPAMQKVPVRKKNGGLLVTAAILLAAAAAGTAFFLPRRHNAPELQETVTAVDTTEAETTVPVTVPVETEPVQEPTKETISTMPEETIGEIPATVLEETEDPFDDAFTAPTEENTSDPFEEATEETVPGESEESSENQKPQDKNGKTE